MRVLMVLMVMAIVSLESIEEAQEKQDKIKGLLRKDLRQSARNREITSGSRSWDSVLKS